jgi:hypothetical protein
MNGKAVFKSRVLIFKNRDSKNATFCQYDFLINFLILK